MSEDKRASENEKIQMPAGDPRLQRPETAPPLVRTTRIVIWAGLAVLVIALFWWGLIGHLTRGPVILGAIGIGGVLFWLALNLRAVRDTAGTRSAKLVLNSVAFLVFVLGVLVCINILAARSHPRLDLTEGKIHSLSPQTLKVVQSLDEAVELIVFLPQEYSGAESSRQLLDLYNAASPLVKVTYADYTDVSLAEQYEITVAGTVVVKAGERQEKVSSISEQRLTSALMALTSKEKMVIYLLTGHGEASLSGGQSSIAMLKSDLTNQQYEVKELDLAGMEKPQVPGDCSVLAIIGAHVPLAEEEEAAIEKYVDRQGKLLLALAPPPAPDFSSLLSKRGLTVLDGLVIDPGSNLFGNPAVLLVDAKAGSPVLEGIDRLVLPLSRGLKVEESSAPQPSYPGAPPPPPSGPANSVLSSTGNAWLQTSLEGGVEFPAAGSTQSYPVLATIDETPPRPPQMPGMAPPPEREEADATRMVVLGSAEALTDQWTGSIKYNSYLALNSIAWLSQNVRLISIPPKQERPRNLLLTNTQKNFIVFVVLFFIPLIVIVTGGVVWWTRRRG